MRGGRLGASVLWFLLVGCAANQGAVPTDAPASGPPDGPQASIAFDLPPAPPVARPPRAGAAFGRSAPGLLKLYGESFVRGVDNFYVGEDGDDPPELLWQVLERIEVEKDSWRWPFMADMRYGRIADALLARGSAADFERMLRTYDQLPPDSNRRTELVRTLAHYRIRQHVAALSGVEHPALRLKSVPTLPAHLANAPGELQDAWRLHRATLGSEGERAFPPTATLVVQGALPTFHSAVSALLHHRDGDHVASLARFSWDSGGCVKRSPEEREPLHLANLLALLEQRRHADALAVILRSPGTFKARRYSPEEAAWVRPYLDWWGADALVLHAGAAADGEYSAHAKLLARDGRERAARYLLALSEIPKNSFERSAHLYNLATFVDPGRHGHNPWRRGQAVTITAPLQRAALVQIMDAIQPHTDTAVIETAAHILTELLRPESKAVLRVVAGLPLENTKRSASAALRRLGDAGPVLAPAAPVRVGVTVNGRPFDGQPVMWTVQYPEGRSTGGIAVVKGGLLGLDRDHFSGRSPIGLLLERRRKTSALGGREEGPEAPWFNVTIEVPRDLDAIAAVDLRLGGLTVSIPARPPSTGVMEVSLTRTGELWRTEGFRSVHAGLFDLTVSARVTFPLLQEGKYDVGVTWPDGRHWTIREAIVGDGMTTTVADGPVAPPYRYHQADPP